MRPKILYMFKFFFLFLSFLSINLFAVTIDLPKESYRVDREKRMIVCNTDLSKIVADDQAIKFKINGDVYNLLDNIKELKIGIRYTLAQHQGSQRFSIYFTELPLLFIDSNAEISDSPKVLSQISLVENNGIVTVSSAGIEYRGATSQSYPKKSFEIEFWKDQTGKETQDLALLGMREDKDWNLQALYNEPLKIASITAWEIWETIGKPYYATEEPKAKLGVSSEFVELFLNDSYQGIYVVAEKIDRKQLKLKKNTETEIRGELYKGSSWGATTYYELPALDNASEEWGGFEYKYPKDLRDWSKLYNLHDFVLNSDSDLFYSEYKNKYDNDNLVDYFIFLNLLRITDNTGKNLYTARYDKNGKYFFVPWDLDGVLGRIWDSTIENKTDDILSNGLYDRLQNDDRPDGFRFDLSKRWTSLRSDFITTDNIMQLLLNNYSYLKVNSAYERDQLANSGSTISSEYEEFAFIREWLTKRIEFLDKAFGFETTQHEDAAIDQNTVKFQFYPNPAKSSIYFINKKIKTENTFLDIDIYTLSGRKVRSVSQSPLGQSVFIGNLPNGNYLMNIKGDAGVKQSFKLIIDK